MRNISVLLCCDLLRYNKWTNLRGGLTNKKVLMHTFKDTHVVTQNISN